MKGRNAYRVRGSRMNGREGLGDSKKWMMGERGNRENRDPWSDSKASSSMQLHFQAKLIQLTFLRLENKKEIPNLLVQFIAIFLGVACMQVCSLFQLLQLFGVG